MPLTNKRLQQLKRLNKRDAGIKYSQHIVLDPGNSVIKIPKLGWVKYRNSRDILGKIKNVTISRNRGQYRLSIQTKRDLENQSHPSSTAVGMDLGVVNFATLSDRMVIPPKNSFKALSEKLAKAQRKLKAKFSNKPWGICIPLVAYVMSKRFLEGFQHVHLVLLLFELFFFLQVHQTCY